MDPVTSVIMYTSWCVFVIRIYNIWCFRDRKQEHEFTL